MKNKFLILASILLLLILLSIIGNNLDIIDNYGYILKYLYIVLWYIILPIQVVYLVPFFDSRIKRNILIDSSFVIVRIIVQYVVQPMIFVSSSLDSIFGTLPASYQIILPYIIFLLTLFGIYRLIRWILAKLFNY